MPGPWPQGKPRVEVKGRAEDRPTITDMAARWQAEIDGQRTKQTAHQHRAAVAELIAFLPERAGVQAVGRRTAGELASAKLLASPASSSYRAG